VVARDGSVRGRLTSVAEEPSLRANVTFTTAGRRVLNAAIVRPRDARPGMRYPVILYVYGGPHGQEVVRTPRSYLLRQWIADRGFVVVSIDGRGTPGRGREWERAIKGNLIEIPLADQVEALQALGASNPDLDLTRTGVYGWSFGGYFSAHATMQRPDVFRAGVAGAPVADWRDYDTFYTERYMDLPESNAAGYDASSVLTYADRLERPLMIVHGTVDDNVYFLHSMKLSDALFRAGKPFEFVPLAGFTHMVPDPVVTRRLYGRIADFFQRHLGRPEPEAPASIRP
jgi:dipeptidyl-peptidase-4